MEEIIKPLGSRVYVKPYPKKKTTDSGIILSDISTGKPSTGTVLAIGLKCSVVKVGDIVLYPTTGGTEIEGNLILLEDELLAII
jgi:chaperonin GroES